MWLRDRNRLDVQTGWHSLKLKSSRALFQGAIVIFGRPFENKIYEP
jgi:hypothetical protein